MSLFRKESAAESESLNEKQEPRESSMVSRFTDWINGKINKADQTVFCELSAEGGAIGKAMKGLFDLKYSDYKNAAIFAACTPIAALLLLNGGKLVLSAMIPGMEHMATNAGMIPDDLASIPGTLIDAFGQALHMGVGVDAATAAVPHVDVTVTPEVAPMSTPVAETHHQIEWSDDGDGGDHHYAYKNLVHGERVDGFTPINKDNQSNLDQNPFNPEDQGASSDKYEKLIKSVHHHKGHSFDSDQFGADKPSTPEAGITDTPAVATPEQQHAETIKSDVEKAFTPGTAEEHAKNIRSDVESHFNSGDSPAETAKNVKSDVEKAFTPGTAEEHAKKISESIFPDAA